MSRERDILKQIERRERVYMRVAMTIVFVIGVPLALAVTYGGWMLRCYLLRYVLEH